MHLNSELIFKKYAVSYFKDNYRVLEIGPDDVPSTLKKLVNNPTIIWDTVNIRSPEAEHQIRNNQLTMVSENEYEYPVLGNAYDIVVSSNVMEHVRMFWKWFDELKRVIKPGGLIITVAPISWPYHEAPVDCWRVYPDGLRALYDSTGLTDVFTTFESIEADAFINTNTPLIPSVTTGNPKKVKIVKAYNAILKYLPFTRIFRVPITVAYDLISIGQKPL